MEEQTNTNISKVEVIEATAVEAMERALIDMQIATAKRYPRPPLSKIRENMMDFVTLDEETAASCFFTLPRGGKAIQGESIRMAEIAISQYQNVRVRTRIIAMVTTGESPYVIVQGETLDLEKNFGSSIEKRRRIIKKKFKDTIDEDDINLAVNACSAIAYRDATFKIIPKVLIKPVFEAAKKVAIGDIRSLATKRTEVVDRLKKMGATQDRILAVVEARTIEDITVEKLQILIGLGTALKDGETTLEDAFPAIPTATTLGAEAVKAKLGRPKGAKNIKPQDGVIPPPETPDHNLEAKKKAQLDKLAQTPPKGKYKCGNKECNFVFDEPAKDGIEYQNICPECGSRAFTEIKPEPEKAEFHFKCKNPKCPNPDPNKEFSQPTNKGLCPHCLTKNFETVMDE